MKGSGLHKMTQISNQCVVFVKQYFLKCKVCYKTELLYITKTFYMYIAKSENNSAETVTI